MDRSGEGTFPKSNRLRGRSDFLKALQSEEAKKYAGKYCRLAVAQSADGRTRFGMIISKGTGGAVRRNKVKRVIREFLRDHKDLWPSGKMIAISVSKPLSDETALISEIEAMLGDLK
jgi:ribonuclease P protein component